MKYSEITLKEKENELLELVFHFSKNIIPDIDNVLKNGRIQRKEAPYIDLIADSFFSIQSYCILSKEGLISSSFAIFRIILEQVATAFLLSKNAVAKESFINIKMRQNEYWLANKEDRKTILNKICSENNIPKNEMKLKKYFDYGWGKSIGCNTMNLESICKAAGIGYIYKMVDVVINGFSHGSRSIFQFQRNNVDKELIRTIRQYTFRLFFFLVSAMVTEFGKDCLSELNQKSYSMAKALFWDIQSRLDEQFICGTMDKGDIESIIVDKYIEQAYNVLCFLDKAMDERERYLLSQAFIRTIRLVVVLSTVKKWNLNVALIKDFNLTNLFNSFNLWDKIELKSRFFELPVLLKMIDSANDDWGLVGSEIDYAFTNSIVSLLEGLK